MDISPPHRVLILGGARSGKSAEAERRLADAPVVTYVAAGGPRDRDAEWAERVAAHRARRPPHWRTVETTDVASMLTEGSTEGSGALLIDCLGLWLTSVMDECGAWEGHSWESGQAQAAVRTRVDELVAAWRAATAHVVAVSNEVGMGVVPETTAGRRFRDELGRLNTRLAAYSDEVLLVVAGRTLAL
jgi:adenosylcobinamide kinase/adenosylcobinamide-phosphate guanylyltransferase